MKALEPDPAITMFSPVIKMRVSVIAIRKRLPGFSFAILLSTTLLPGVFGAMDAVIPGMENASEARQKAIRDQQARDSVRQQEEVGRQRFELRMQYKSRLNEGMRMEAAARKDAIAKEIEMERLAIQDSRNNTGKALRFFACMGVLSSGAFLFRRQISSIGWVTALEEWFSSPRPEPEDPAKRIARLERLAAMPLVASGSSQGTESVHEDGKTHSSSSSSVTDKSESKDFRHLLLRSGVAKTVDSNVTAPVDMQELLACANGDVQNMSEMAVLYLEQTRSRIDKIRTALSNGSSMEAMRFAKMSASASELCGMKSIGMTFERLQDTIQKDAIAEALAMVESVENEYSRVSEFLQNHPSLRDKFKSAS